MWPIFCFYGNHTVVFVYLLSVFHTPPLSLNFFVGRILSNKVQLTDNRQKKLTLTLFMMTILFAIGSFVYLTSNSIYSLYYRKNVNAQYALLVLSYTNSLVSPIIYTIRMPEFRQALLMLFKRRPKKRCCYGSSSSPLEYLGAPCKGIRIPECGKLFLVESGIQGLES